VDATIDFGAHGRFGDVAPNPAAGRLLRAGAAAALSVGVALAVRKIGGRVG